MASPRASREVEVFLSARLKRSRSTVRFRGMGTDISEASKRVPISSFAKFTQGGKQVSSHFRQGNWVHGHDHSLFFLLKQNPPLVYPIQMLREFACYLPVQRRHHGLFSFIRDDAICARRLFQVPRSETSACDCADIPPIVLIIKGHGKGNTPAASLPASSMCASHCSFPAALLRGARVP